MKRPVAGREAIRSSRCRRSASRSNKTKTRRSNRPQRAADLHPRRGTPVRQTAGARKEARGARKRSLRTRQSEQARLVKEEVGEEEIAADREPVDRRTGHPKLLEGEKQKLLASGRRVTQARDRPGRGGRLPSSEAVIRARSGLKDPNRPIGSFIFLGTDGRRQNGTGPCARGVPLRRRKGDDPHRHERVPGEAHRSRGWWGRPPGYVGYDEGGQLTEAVRRRPYCSGAVR